MPTITDTPFALRAQVRRAIVVSGALIAVMLQSAWGAQSTPAANIDLANALQIRIETSRAEPAMGTGLGILAELKNTSKYNIYLTETKVVLTVPPELQSSFAGVANWWSIFPTQHAAGPAIGTDGNVVTSPPYVGPDGKVTLVPESWLARIMLAPGATYRVAWSSGPSVTNDEGRFSFIFNNWSVIKSELNFLFFSPGEYKVSVVLQYWASPDMPADKYWTTTESAKVHVNAPQSVILFGSALGGLIAYILLPTRRRAAMDSAKQSEDIFTSFFSTSARVVRVIAGLLGAMLLSAIVTILLARISETQFLIRVSIVDFWGAVAIGFLANFAGIKVFEKFAPGGLSSSKELDNGAAKENGSPISPASDKSDA